MLLCWILDLQIILEIFLVSCNGLASVITSHLPWDSFVVGGTAVVATPGSLLKLKMLTQIVLHFAEVKSGGEALHFCLKPSR